MKIIVDKSDLRAALQIAGRIRQRGVGEKFLAAVVVRTGRGNRITVSATNLVVDSTSTVEAKVERKGAFAIDHDVLSKIADAASAAPIELDYDGTLLDVRCGPSRYRVPTMTIEHAPRITSTDGVSWHTVSRAGLCELLHAVAFAVADDATRPHLCGVRLWSEGGYLCAVATDGHRLATARFAEKIDIAPVVLPQRAVDAFCAALSRSGQDLVELSVSGARVCLHVERDVITSAPVDGEYVQFNRVIPERVALPTVVSSDLLSGALARARVLVGDAGITLTCAAGEITMSVVRDSGQFFERIPVDGEASWRTALNPKYLRDWINAGANGAIELSVTGELAPVRCDTLDDRVCVIMPMRA